MNILATAQEEAREDFFLHFLADQFGGPSMVRPDGVTYASDQTFYFFRTPSGPLQIRVFETDAPDEISIHLSATLRALLPDEKRIPDPGAKTKWRFGDFKKPLMSDFFPAVFLVDCTLKDFDRPFVIQHRPDGVNLWSALQARYFFRAGQVLAQMHNRAGLTDAAEEGLLASFDATLDAAAPHMPTSLHNQIAAMPRDTADKALTLVNNRYFGPNVWVDVRDNVQAVDWSHAVMDDPLADLLPMKYWTTINSRTDTLQHDAVAWNAFINGYGAGAVHALFLTPAARAMEATWLMAQLAAECARRKQGDIRSPYPEPDDYLDHLDLLMNG